LEILGIADSAYTCRSLFFFPKKAVRPPRIPNLACLSIRPLKGEFSKALIKFISPNIEDLFPYFLRDTSTWRKKTFLPAPPQAGGKNDVGKPTGEDLDSARSSTPVPRLRSGFLLTFILDRKPEA